MTVKSIDIRQLIDHAPLGKLHVYVAILCGSIAFLDGFDTTAIGVVAPSIAHDFKVQIASFGPVFTSALIGAALGAISAGPLADRFGRKPLLLGTIVIFGIFSFLSAFCQDIGSLIVVRFVAGIGMGGATPCLIALASEYAPTRHRSAIVTAVWSCFPLGGMAGAFGGSLVMARFGWHAVFYLGGIAPLLLAPILLVALPDSMHYILRARRASSDLWIMRIAGKAYAADTEYHVPGRAEENVGTLKALFSDGNGLQTICLWLALALAFAVIVIVTLWTPALFSSFGLASSDGAVVVGVFNFGCTIGMAGAGLAMQRVGPAYSIPLPLTLGGFAVIALGVAGEHHLVSLLLSSFAGLSIGIGASGLIALAALIYPTEVRATGVGWALGFTRFGQAIAPTMIGGLLTLLLSFASIFLAVGLLPMLSAAFALRLVTRAMHRRSAASINL